MLYVADKWLVERMYLQKIFDSYSINYHDENIALWIQINFNDHIS